MTRNEAKILAQEIYKLMKKDIKELVSQAVAEETDEYMSTKQAAELLGVSISYLLHSDLPKTKVGKLNKYKKSDLIKSLER